MGIKLEDILDPFMSLTKIIQAYIKQLFKMLLHLGRDLKCTDLRALGPEGISRTWFHHFNGLLILVDR